MVRSGGSEKVTFKLNLITIWIREECIPVRRNSMCKAWCARVTKGSVWMEPTGTREILAEITQLLVSHGQDPDFYSGCDGKP